MIDKMMMSKLIICIVIVSLTVTGGRCMPVCDDVSSTTIKCTCTLATQNQFGEYQEMADVITDTSCPFVPKKYFISYFDANFEVENKSSLVNTVFQNLNETCRRYTETLAFKDQVQKVLFSKNETVTINNGYDVLRNIILLLKLLQTAAMKLQDIALGTSKRYCATFTSTQYEVIYISKLQEGKRLLESLCYKSIKWQRINELYGAVCPGCLKNLYA